MDCIPYRSLERMTSIVDYIVGVNSRDFVQFVVVVFEWDSKSIPEVDLIKASLVARRNQNVDFMFG